MAIASRTASTDPAKIPALALDVDDLRIGAAQLGSARFRSHPAASGLVLDQLIPGLVYERSTMQIGNMIHNVAAVLMMCLFAGHIYLGTIGMRGAYSAMRRGYVDEAWAKEHHAYWYEDVKAGKIPAQRSSPPAVALEPDNVRPA